MGEQTGIEWADHTFNPIRGCSEVSSGCANCYAKRLSLRNEEVLGKWGRADGRRVTAAPSYWNQPLRWDRAANAAGTTATVFCASLADMAEPWANIPAPDREAVEEARNRTWALVEKTGNLRWLFLTKHPDNIAKIVPAHWKHYGYPLNVWWGTSVEGRDYQYRLDHLAQVPVHNNQRFVSFGPLIDRLDMPALVQGADAFRWWIVEGESGKKGKVRPTHPDWLREIRDVAGALGVPFFFKQWGEWGPVQPGDNDVTWRNSVYVSYFGGKLSSLMKRPPDKDEAAVVMKFYGRKHNPKRLDGVTYLEFPDWGQA